MSRWARTLQDMGRPLGAVMAAAAVLVVVGLVLLTTVPPAGAQTGGTSPTSNIGQKLRELNEAGVEIRQVAFTPSGGAVILHGTNAATWIRAPQAVGDRIRSLVDAGRQVRFAACDKLVELNRAGVAIRSMAYAPGGGWVILHAVNEVTWSGIPQATVAKIRELYQAGNRMKQIAFTASGGWIILYGSNGYSWVGLE